jgi:hypothetical protein
LHFLNRTQICAEKFVKNQRKSGESASSAFKFWPVMKSANIVLPGDGSLTIQGAAHSQATAIEDVGVDHGRLDALVPQQFLDGANIIA